MPTLVEVPGLGSIEFPDGMSNEDIRSSIKNLLSKQKGGETANEQNQPKAYSDRNAQREANQQVRPSDEEGVQADSVLRPQDQSERERIDQANLTDERQTQDAQGGIQGTQAGQGLESQVPARNQEEVEKGGVQPAPEKPFLEKVKEDPKSAIVAGVATAAEAGIPLLAGSIAASVITPLATGAAVGTGPAAPFLGAGAGLTAFAGVADVTKRIVEQTEKALGITPMIKEAQAKQPEITKATEIATIAPFVVKSGAGLIAAGKKGIEKAIVEGSSVAAGAAKEVGKRLAAGGAAGTLYEAGIRYPVEKGIQMVAGGKEPAKPTLESTAESALMMAALSGAGEEIIRKAGLPETAKVAGSMAPDADVVRRMEKPAPVAEQPAEATAEAQPTKPSETKIEETSGLPALERRPVEPETAVKAEEGVAPREGEGEEKVAIPEGARVAAAAYLAPDRKTYEGASHLDAMQNAKKAGAITQDEIDAKQTAESRNTEEFGYAVTLPDGTRTTTTREAAGKIAKASGQALKEEFDFGDKMHSNETKLDDFPSEEEVKATMETPEYIKRREEVLAGSGPSVMRSVPEKVAKMEISKLRQSQEFKEWEETKEQLKSEWRKSPLRSEERKNAKDAYREHIKNKPDKKSEEFKTWKETKEKLLTEWKKSPLKSKERQNAENAYREHIKNKPESEFAYYIQADELVRRKSLTDEDVMSWVNSLTPDQAKIEYERAIFAPASESIAPLKGKLAVRRVLDLEEAGDIEGAARIYNEIAREQTTAAYVLRDAQFLLKSTPKGFTTILEKVAKSKDITIKPDKISQIQNEFSEFNKSVKLSEAKANEAINATSEKEFKSKLKELEKIRRDGLKKQNILEKSVGGIWPKSGREELIPSLMKGNFLTPMSIVTNLDQNIIKGPFVDLPKKMTASLYSKLDSAITGKEREYVFGIEQAAKYLAVLAKESPDMVANVVRSILRQPLPIDKPVNITEIRNALNPSAAWKRLSSIYKKDNLQYEGDYKFKDKIKDLIEGTSGITADIAFDFLAATDLPTRKAAKFAEASGMARRLGISGLDYEKFLMFPEKGIEKYVRDNVSNPSQRAEKIKTLKNELADAVSESVMESEISIQGKSLTKGVSSALKWASKTNPVVSILAYSTIPYIRVPLNFAALSLKFANPELAFASFLMNTARGNSKKAAMDFGMMAVGSVFAYTGAYLWSNGIIETTDSPQTKQARLSGEVGRSGTINMSKLNRLINGESLETMQGDDIRRLDKLGLPGVAMLLEADKQEKLKQKKLLTGKLSFGDAVFERMKQMPASLSYTLNQTFTKGVAGVLDAITKGEWDNWALKTFEASLSMVVPNTFAATSRAVSDYAPELKDPSFTKSLENIIRQRFGVTGNLPIKRDFWGEKVRSTPEGANPIIYHFVDFTKKRDIPSVAATMEIVRLWDKTQDKRVIPSEVQKSITIKKTEYQLSPKDYERYQIIVGQERLSRINKLLDSPSYQSASFDRKAFRFGKVLDLGKNIGERKFLKEIQKSSEGVGKVIKIPREELIKRISELESEQ